MAEITLGGTPCKTNGELPANGTKITGTFVKNDLTELQLADFQGKKVILNIFPSVDTAVCSASVRMFNKHAAGLENTAILCISRDLPFAQARFCGAEGIDNVLTVSDFRSPEFAENLGLRIIDGGFKGLDARSVIILNEAGEVSYTQLVKEIGDEPDYESALNAVK